MPGDPIDPSGQDPDSPAEPGWPSPVHRDDDLLADDRSGGEAAGDDGDLGSIGEFAVEAAMAQHAAELGPGNTHEHGNPDEYAYPDQYGYPNDYAARHAKDLPSFGERLAEGWAGLRRAAAGEPAEGPGEAVARQWLGRFPEPVWWQDLRATTGFSPWAPRAVLGFVVLLFCAVFIPLTVNKHRYYGTFDFDMGVFDQATWLLAHGRGFITVRGLLFWGHHLNLGLIVFAPAYWLGAGPELLMASAVLAYAAAAVLLAQVASYFNANRWYGVFIAAIFLSHHALQNQLAEGFHPEKIAAPFMIGAILAALHRRWGWFAVAVVGTIVWKEDLALFVFMLGMAVAWKRSLRVGLITAGAAAAYFFLATQVILPVFSPSGPFYAGFMGPLGDGPVDWLRVLLTDQGQYHAAYESNNGNGYLTGLSVPFGGVPFLAPATWLLVLPTLFINLFSAQGYTGEIFRQYAVAPLMVTAVAAVRGLLSRRTVAVRLGLCGLMLVGSLATINQGSSPLSDRHRSGIWPLAATDRIRLLDELVATVPDGDSVAATYYIVPHLTRRAEVYTFPNPWIPVNWGVADSDPRDGGRVDWLLVDTGIVASDERFDALLTRLRTEQFETVVEQDGIALLRRVQPGE